MDQVSTKKMTPGDDMHLTLLMAPHNLNLVTGQDRQHLLAFGRAAFEAGQKCQDMLAAAPQPPEAAPQQGVRQAYVLEDDGHETYLDGCESRFSIRRADGECVAWVAPLDKDSGEAVAREMIAALNAAHPTPQGLDAQVQDRLDRLYLALEVCSAELFAQCAHQGRAMKYVDQARYALAAEQCARAAQAKQGGV